MAVALALALGASACNDDDGASVPPVDTTVRTDTALRVDLVASAITAVETERGGPQRYTEINVNPEGVSLFVAIDDTSEAAYFYDGVLDSGTAPTALTSTPFALDGVGQELAPDLVKRTQADLPGSQVTQLALVTTPDLGLVWALASRSARGGTLNVFYSPSGALLSAVPDDD
jgi:hypothetical protein